MDFFLGLPLPPYDNTQYPREVFQDSAVANHPDPAAPPRTFLNAQYGYPEPPAQSTSCRGPPPQWPSDALPPAAYAYLQPRLPNNAILDYKESLNGATIDPTALRTWQQSLPGPSHLHAPIYTPSARHAVPAPAWIEVGRAMSGQPGNVPRCEASSRPVHRVRPTTHRPRPFPNREQLAAVRAAGQDRRRADSGRAAQTDPLFRHFASFPVSLADAAPSEYAAPSVRPTQRLQAVVQHRYPSLSAVQFPPQPPVYVSRNPFLPHAITYPNAAPRRPYQIDHDGITFNITHILGEGSAGRVVLGEHAGRLYAIKAIHQGRAKRAHSHRDNFLREKDLMVATSHSRSSRQFFVPLLMSWEEESYGSPGRIFFVMPVCPIDMFNALKTRQPMTLKDRYMYCQELICALCALRDIGIVHRDIKPGNILINFRGQAVLTDFGMAQKVPVDEFETWRREAYSGTYAYMAPEMVRTESYGSAVDVWSLGLVFLEILMFTSTRYFSSESLQAIQQEHGKKLPVAFQVPSGFDPVFANIVRSMLEVDPAKRITARELDSRYASSNSWTSVRNGTAQHEWIPTLDLLKRRDASRCLDFLTHQAAGGPGADHIGAHAVWGSAQTQQFEYRAPGAFS